MRESRIPSVMLICLFWSAPTVLPLLSFPLWHRPDRIQPAEPGLRWLSMPHQLFRVPDPLAGWAFLDEAAVVSEIPDGETASMEAVDEAVGSVAEPRPRSSPHIRLYGRIRSGNSTVYCFLDTKGGRWFRLAEGETDPVSGMRLRAAPDGTDLRLVGTTGQVHVRFDPSAPLTGEVPFP